MNQAVHRFRDVFEFGNKNVLRWFPGHMGKGMKQMQQQLKSVDCIIEVHDARIPLSGRNEQFKYTVSGVRPHILVLNKKDLTDLSHRDKVHEHFKREGLSDVIYTNCKADKCTGLNKVIPTAINLIKTSDRFSRSEKEDYRVMVIGVPNVGKSSIINSIRNRHLHKPKAAPVGAIAGITRSVATQIKVCEEPRIYVLDTPGILNPRVENIETGFKLALCSTMQDHLVGIRNIADYLLFFLNKKKRFEYVEVLGIEKATDCIEEVLVQTAVSIGKMLKRKGVDGGYTTMPDMDAGGHHFVKLFRTGSLGKFVLDDL